MPEAEARDPRGEAILAEQFGKRDRADVGGLREDLRDAHRLGSARLRVVDPAVGDLDRIGQRELFLWRDDSGGERTANGDELEGRAWLVGVGDRAVALSVPRHAGEAV